MIGAVFEIIRWLVAGPILLARFILHAFRWFDFWVVSYRHEIPCRNCGSAISRSSVSGGADAATRTRARFAVVPGL